MLIAPVPIMADEWTIGNWNIWAVGAHNVTYAIGFNDTTNTLLFKMWEESDRPYNKGLALLEAVVAQDKTPAAVRSWAVKNESLIDMLKNYTIKHIQYDRGTGTPENAWYVCAYVYLWANHSIVNENTDWFDDYRIYHPQSYEPQSYESRSTGGTIFTELSEAGSSTILLLAGIGIVGFILVLVVFMWRRRR